MSHGMEMMSPLGSSDRKFIVCLIFGASQPHTGIVGLVRVVLIFLFVSNRVTFWSWAVWRKLMCHTVRIQLSRVNVSTGRSGGFSGMLLAAPGSGGLREFVACQRPRKVRLVREPRGGEEGDWYIGQSSCVAVPRPCDCPKGACRSGRLVGRVW